MKTKIKTYTPGPWEALGVVVCAGTHFGGQHRCVHNPGPSMRGLKEMEANARLIAAAPELLEAVKLLQAALTEYKLRDVRKRASLCIADAAASSAAHKATGGI